MEDVYTVKNVKLSKEDTRELYLIVYSIAAARLGLELKDKEIAEILGVHIKSVSRIYISAIKRLKYKIDRSWLDES